MSAVLPRLLPRASTSACRRYLSCSPCVYNAAPELESLIGGKEGIERRRSAYHSKYAQALQAKAKSEGVTVEELKKRKVLKERIEIEMKASQKRPASNDTAGPVLAGETETDGTEKVVRPAPSSMKSATKPAFEKADQKSPIKPLNDILDLSKASALSSSAIAQLWTSYHQAKGFLSAAIPAETYEKMSKMGRKYPIFVLPLQRDVSGVDVEGSGASSAVEMYVLEWAFLPPPKSHSALNTSADVPPPSTVLFTPLAEYKARQTYAQPYLILTHYTDLANSHNLVLMRGEVTDNVALDSTLAQVLAVRMQLFYNVSHQSGTEMDKLRLEMVKNFHENPNEFDIQALIDSAEISKISA